MNNINFNSFFKGNAMDMNKAFFLPKEQSKPKWILIDARGKVVGRLATQVAKTLMGKDEVFYTPHTDSGDYVVIINAKEAVFTGDKEEQKVYEFYTGYIGNKKFVTAKQMREKHPERILELAVKRMMRKNKLDRQTYRKLLVYAGPEHPHQAQFNTAAKADAAAAKKK